MATAIIPRWRKAKPKDYNLKFEQLYEKMDEVGSGVYGTVYMARRRSDGLMVALKVTDVDSEGILPTTIKEVTILRNCAGHPHLVNLLDVRLCFLSMKHYMVMELCETDLEIYARSQALDGGIPPPVVREFIRQILSALQFMHAKDINHRDLKPSMFL